ncbi:substrate-binding domain-containing protein [Pullulanibacillus sp. KACC 23026]|uniref:substrate-binding domain-containing protein n=1 Tax=Pullulanibacillus sp. KACC 23026 TaxID=3028315 RepID=UPI0023AF6277|nr:substrate-binding domain-containing protein [Pullulanibacillus sp. KACC 23026]WEG13357.1 substrate-binding domain-containing protein [Pullulanibacillus sp. KACC 23026]
MKKKGFALILVMVMAMSLLAACGSSSTKSSNSSGSSSSTGSSNSSTSSNKQLKIGFAIKTQNSPYFVSLVNAVKKDAKAQGWSVTVLDANSSTQTEASNMESFVAQKMDLIFIDAIDPSAAVPEINQAAAAGIPVIALDSGVDPSAKTVTTVYSDNKENGRLVGLAYAKKMANKAIKAVILSGAKGNVAGKERREGLFAGIIEGKTGVSEAKAWKEAATFDNTLLSKGKATDATAHFSVLGQGWGNWTEADGLTAAEDLITANPDLTTVLGENDQMLFGAMTALKNAGISGVDLVAASDGAKQADDLIKQGKYFGTGLNSPTIVASTGMGIAKQILVDGKSKSSYPKITLTPPVAVTKANVNKYYNDGF